MSDWSGPALNGLAGSFLGLVTITVGVRFYARKHLKVAFGPDDWVMVFAAVNYVGCAICVFISTSEKTLGYNSGEAQSETGNKLGIALNSFLAASLGGSKASALFFYKRIFCVQGRSQVFNILVVSMIVVCACWIVTFEFLSGFQCGTHLSALWDGTYLKYCTISFGYILGFGISGFLLDIIILTMPIPIIARLKTTLARKLSIIGIFLLAGVGLGAATARMVGYIKLEYGGQDYLVHHSEEVLTSSAYFYAVLESGMSIVAVNTPSIWFLCVKKAPEAFLRSVRSAVSLNSKSSKGSNSSKFAHATKQFDESSDGSQGVRGTDFSITQYSTVQVEETYNADPEGMQEERKYGV